MRGEFRPEPFPAGSLPARDDRTPRADALAGAAVAVASAVFLWCTYTLTNDHFDRLSRARQILAFGETPFEDFFDPGFFLTLYSSAAVQALAGHNLLGEAVLDITFSSAGYLIVFLLATRATRSRAFGVGAVAVALAVSPRPYDYDKVLFYPWGLLACWRYIDRPSARSLAYVAGVAALAALYRYDSGVYLATAALAGIVVRHWGAWKLMAGRVFGLGVALLACLSPALLFLQSRGGIARALDQILTYARREGARSELFALPRPQTDPASLLYVLAVVWPLVAAGIVVLARRSQSQAARARLLCTAALIVIVTVFVLRDPIPARIGAAVPVIIVLGVLVAAESRQWLRSVPTAASTAASRPAAGLTPRAVALGAGALLATSAVAATLYPRPRPELGYLARSRAADLARTPPRVGLADHYVPLVAYVRECTAPGDRVLATWFVPELYFYSGRGFAGGLAVVFGDHWREPRFQQDAVRWLERQRVPLVIMRGGARESDTWLHGVYPLVAAFVRRRYELAALSDFGLSRDTYPIWVRRGVPPVRRYAPFDLPCYTQAEASRSTPINRPPAERGQFIGDAETD